MCRATEPLRHGSVALIRGKENGTAPCRRPPSAGQVRYSARDPAERLRTAAKPAAARPNAATSPAMSGPRSVDSLAEAVDPALSKPFVLADEAVEAPPPSCAPLAVSLSTGAGFSSSWPPWASIQRTILPSEYVCRVLKVSWSVSSGSWPKPTLKSSYCPGAIFPPLKVISETASVMVPSSVLTAVLSLVVVT